MFETAIVHSMCWLALNFSFVCTHCIFLRNLIVSMCWCIVLFHYRIKSRRQIYDIYYKKYYTLSKEIYMFREIWRRYRYKICDVRLLRLMILQNNIKTFMHSPMSILFPILVYISYSYVCVLFTLSMIFVCNI